MTPGKKGAWNRDLNKPLDPNTKYITSDTKYEFTTDGLGRVTRVKAQLTKIEKSDRHQNAQTAAGDADRLSTDHGGHLIGSRFNGPGERLNLVPQNGNLNQSAWDKMENRWAKAIDAGAIVDVDIKVHYPGGSKRPKQFVVRYVVRHGESSEIHTCTFDNVAGPGECEP